MREATEKLPLTARKNVRDEWESKRSEYEAQMHEILGEAWTIQVNANLLYSYADETYKSRIGSVIAWYMDAFISNVQTFATKFSTDGITELNNTCSAHLVILAPQDSTTQFTYGGLTIQDGTLRIVFAEEALATNVDDVSQDFETALKNAPPPAGGPLSSLNVTARNGIKTDYDAEIETVRAAVAALVGMPDLKFNGNFEANASLLVKSGEADRSWDKKFGGATLDYFQGLKYVLENNKFAGDDMLQEAFRESVDKGEVCVRMVESWSDGSSRYNDVVIENGILYIQTLPKYWWSNVDDAALKIMDIL